MSHLPADMWRHEGFRGCVFDLRVAPRLSGPWTALRLAHATNVKECGTDECNQHNCQNGGRCVELGATISKIDKNSYASGVSAQLDGKGLYAISQVTYVMREKVLATLEHPACSVDQHHLAFVKSAKVVLFVKMTWGPNVPI
ncbi:hypothetical protein SK128_010503 [Halocaridina rubra]|uniref:Uncharacterized protein n=1 Tax=Halocaridina rubra TaxID=373956 RepID=A0AAN8WS64_HALRR